MIDNASSGVMSYILRIRSSSLRVKSSTGVMGMRQPSCDLAVDFLLVDFDMAMP